MSATTGHANVLLSGFLARIRQPRTPYISPARFAKAAGLSVQALSALAGVHRNTFSQHPESVRVQQRLRDMIRAISAATALTGDVDKALYWFLNEPIADYRHRTAAELVAEGHTDAVLTYLEELRVGATG
jgi:hypothetical protein